MSDVTEIKTDVIVVGGGLVGLAVSLGLAAKKPGLGLQVVIVDAQAVDHTLLPQFDGRASAISKASRNMLDALGVWKDLEPHAQPISDIIVSDSQLGDEVRPTFLRFDQLDNQKWPTAFMVENRFMRRALLAQIKQTAGIEFFAPCKVTSMDVEPHFAQVTLDDNRVLSAPLVVAADGRNSYVRRQAGIKTIGWNYRQHGIVASIEHEYSHGGVAEEHFLPAGPFAILPLKQPCHSSLVWTEREDIALELMQAPDDEFDHALGVRFGDHLGKIKRIGPRWSYPLSLQLATDYVAPRLMLVGDAAHVVHPLAGLGFNLGLRDAAALVDVVKDALHLGLDFGTMDVGENYQVWRRFDNLSAALMMEALNRLFSNSSPTLRQIRDMGLGLVEKSPAAKQFFIKEAAGLSGRLPGLMQGFDGV
jgi:2-octaprenyl-6-methoxyphenol hydroxylase